MRGTLPLSDWFLSRDYEKGDRNNNDGVAVYVHPIGFWVALINGFWVALVNVKQLHWYSCQVVKYIGIF